MQATNQLKTPTDVAHEIVSRYVESKGWGSPDLLYCFTDPEFQLQNSIRDALQYWSNACLGAYRTQHERDKIQMEAMASRIVRQRAQIRKHAVTIVRLRGEITGRSDEARRSAIREAVESIYFYGPTQNRHEMALHRIVRVLDPVISEVLENDTRKAFEMAHPESKED